MTDDEAMKFMTRGRYQSEGEAKLKVIRAKQSSVQLSTYFVGRMAHYQLHQAIEREMGDKFSLERYHEAVLDEWFHSSEIFAGARAPEIGIGANKVTTALKMNVSESNTMPESAVAPAVPVKQRHPIGLWTLFLTEMWERFSYYGMRALLVLFMVDAVQGGMGMDDKTATAIYGLYTSAVYLMSLPGGWLADRLFGARRAVWYGGIIIALGHFTLALPWTQTFFLGLIFVVVGSGTLKPNMSGMVGELYPEGGARRDAGFSIFYIGVNAGAALGPWICGWLAETKGWHWGFAAAGVGMVLGLIQFRITRRWIGNAGIARGNETPLQFLNVWAYWRSDCCSFIGVGSLPYGRDSVESDYPCPWHGLRNSCPGRAIFRLRILLCRTW